GSDVFDAQTEAPGTSLGGGGGGTSGAFDAARETEPSDAHIVSIPDASIPDASLSEVSVPEASIFDARPEGGKAFDAKGCDGTLLFADPIVEGLVRANAGVNDGPTSAAQVASLTYLNLTSPDGIRSIEGVECLTSLSELVVDASSAVVDLSPLS